MEETAQQAQQRILRGVSDVTESLSRVQAAKELLRLERRIVRAEEALHLFKLHRDRLLLLIRGA